MRPHSLKRRCASAASREFSEPRVHATATGAGHPCILLSMKTLRAISAKCLGPATQYDSPDRDTTPITVPPDRALRAAHEIQCRDGCIAEFAQSGSHAMNRVSGSGAQVKEIPNIVTWMRRCRANSHQLRHEKAARRTCTKRASVPAVRTKRHKDARAVRTQAIQH